MPYRTGVVSAVDAATHRARVKFADRQGVESPWLDVLVRWAHEDKEYSLPAEGELVAVMMDEKDESGAVIGGIYSSVDEPTQSVLTKRRLDLHDGGFVEYDKESGTLTVHAVTKVVVEASDEVTIDAPSVKVNGGAMGAARQGDAVIAGPFAGTITAASTTTKVG